MLTRGDQGQPSGGWLWPVPILLRPRPLSFQGDQPSTSFALLLPSINPLPPLSFFFSFSLSLPPDSQPCPPHIRHMATLGSKLAKVLTCIHRTTLHHNILLLILQPLSLGSMSLFQTLFPAHLAPPPARQQSSHERVYSIGRHFRPGGFGYVGSGYVRRVSSLCSTHG